MSSRTNLKRAFERNSSEKRDLQRFVRLKHRGKETMINIMRQKKNEKRKETERGRSSCRRRPISGSGELIHFILCALERRSIKAGKSYRDSTPAWKKTAEGEMTGWCGHSKVETVFASLHRTKGQWYRRHRPLWIVFVAWLRQIFLVDIKH